MNNSWRISSLNDLCEIYQPKTISTKEMIADGQYVVFGANGIIGRYNKFNHEEPQLLITCRGATCGSVNISQPKSWITGNAMVVRPRSDLLDRSFLKYYFIGICDFSKIITGAAQPQITRQSLAPIKISFPSLPEQRRIVAILDEAFAGLETMRANAEKNLNNAQALQDAILTKVFGDDSFFDIKKLGDYCDILNGFAFKSNDAIASSNTQLVRMGNLYGNVLDLTRKPVFYPDYFTNEFNKYLLSEGDLILSLTGTTGKEDYGYAVCVPPTKIQLLLNQRIAKFIIKNHQHLNKIYLLQYLKSRVFLDKLYLTANGTRQANLSSDTIKTLPLPICSFDKQNELSEMLQNISNKVEALSINYSSKLQILEELKQSILHKAFSGELTSSDVAA